MKLFVVVLLAGPVLLNACSNHNQPAKQTRADGGLNLPEASPDSDATKNTFFPVADYLEAEILHVDSSLLAIHKYTTRNGHTDSSFILLPEFNTLALQFVPEELANGSFEKNFTETSFQDKTTRSITFTYSTVVRDAALQRVDVLTVPGSRAMQVRSVYMEKSRVAGDSVILQKLYWRAQQSFEIATLIRVKGRQPVEQQLRVVWDNPPEEE